MWPPAQAFCSLAAIALLLLLGAVHAIAKLRWRWNSVALIFFVMAALTLVRDMPLLGFLGGEVTRSAAELWGRSPASSAAPGRLPLAALRLLGLGAMLQIWMIRFRNSGGLERTLKALAILLGALVGIGVLHQVAGIEGVFGVFSPVDIPKLRHPLSAPFVNENQIGALYGLGAVVLLCVAQESPRHRFWALSASVALLAIAALVFGAYAAVVAAVVAMSVFGLALALPIHRNQLYARALMGLGGLATLGMAIGAWFVLPRLPFDNAARKAQVWNDTIAAIGPRPFGFGPGVWPDVAGGFMSAPIAQRMPWVEATALDAALDHGWLLVLLVAGNVGWKLYRRVSGDRRQERDVRAATLAVSVYVAGEAVSGMALESMTYAFAVIALLGFTSGRAETRRVYHRSRARIGAGCVAVTLLGAWTLPGLLPSVRLGDAHAGPALDATLHDEGVMSEAFAQTIQAQSALTPIDPVLLTFVADLALVHRDVERASEVSAHLVRYTPGRPQTWRIAVAVAMASDERAAACEAAARGRTTSRSPEAFTANLWMISDDPREWPECVPGAEALEAMYAGLLAEGNRAQALALAMRVLRTAPDDVPSLRAAVEGLFELGDGEYGVSLAKRLLALDPSDERVARLGALMLIRLERPDEALAMLDAALTHAPRNMDLNLTRLEALSALALREDTPQTHAAFEAFYARLLALVSGHPPSAISRLRIAGTYFRTSARWREAENAYQALLRLAPDDISARSALEEIRRERAVLRPASP